MKVSVFCSLWGVFKACSWKDLLLIWPKYCVRIKIIPFSSSQNNYLLYLGRISAPVCCCSASFTIWLIGFWSVFSWCFHFLATFFLFVFLLSWRRHFIGIMVDKSWIESYFIFSKTRNNCATIRGGGAQHQQDRRQALILCSFTADVAQFLGKKFIHESFLSFKIGCHYD